MSAVICKSPKFHISKGKRALAGRLVQSFKSQILLFSKMSNLASILVSPTWTISSSHVFHEFSPVGACASRAKCRLSQQTSEHIPDWLTKMMKQTRFIWMYAKVTLNWKGAAEISETFSKPLVFKPGVVKSRCFYSDFVSVYTVDLVGLWPAHVSDYTHGADLLRSTCHESD